MFLLRFLRFLRCSVFGIRVPPSPLLPERAFEHGAGGRLLAFHQGLQGLPPRLGVGMIAGEIDQRGDAGAAGQTFEGFHRFPLHAV